MAKKASKKSSKKTNKRATQKKLPGMEDTALKDLEKQARAYVDVRDERMELSRQESTLKESLLNLMKKHKKTVYRHADLEIRIVPVEETVKVKILKEKDLANDVDDDDTVAEEEEAVEVDIGVTEHSEEPPEDPS